MNNRRGKGKWPKYRYNNRDGRPRKRGLSGWPRKQRGGEPMRKRKKKPPSQAIKKGRGLLAKVNSLVPFFSFVLNVIELMLRYFKKI